MRIVGGWEGGKEKGGREGRRTDGEEELGGKRGKEEERRKWREG